MKQILVRIICAFCVVSLVLMELITITIARSRTDQDKKYIHSTLLYLEDTIESAVRSDEAAIHVDEHQTKAIREAFDAFSAARDAIYAVVTKGGGETLALSGSDVQPVVNGALEGQAYLDLLRQIAVGKKTFVTVDRSLRLAQAIGEEDYFIVAYKSNADLVRTLRNEILIILAFIVICSGIIMSLCYKLMKKYIFDDLGAVNASIAGLLGGDYSVEFQRPQIDELVPLVDSMGKLKNVFFHKANKMDRLLKVIGPNIGVFECLSNTCLNFYSNSLWSILEVDENRARTFQDSADEFKQFIHVVLSAKGDRGLVEYRHKHLEVHTDETDGDYIGVVIDRTREEAQTLDLMSSLAREREKGLSDVLTGVRNRAGFQLEVERLLSGSGKKGVLLICDLDNFKRVNDGMGHPEGDKVLVLFADCVKAQFRRSDVMGRLGGDEFVIFLPNAVQRDVLKHKLDAVMQSVSEALRPYEKYELGVSIGAGILDEEQGVSDFKQLYASADSALYVAKQMGKSRYYINWEGIRCMNEVCVFCRENCPKRAALESARGSQAKALPAFRSPLMA